MRRYMVFVLLTAGALGMFSACRDNRRAGDVVLATPTQRAGTVAEAPLHEGGQIRTGLGVITSLAGSRSATAGSDGLAQVDSTLVAVTIDENGVITRAGFDAAQTRIGFDARGQITSDLSAPIMTKSELGDAYNMRRVSGIGREYHEQMAALESWARGRTPAQFLSMALNNGRPAAADLTASVTVNISGFLAAMEPAVANARLGNAAGEHRTGLGVVTDLGASRSATSEQLGRARVTSHYAVLTLDQNNRIVAAWIDSSQSEVEFDSAGNLRALPEASPTRYELGDRYGMRQASPIGREWNEQMRDFAQWMIGRTPAEVVGMGLNNGRPSGADLTASVTVNIVSALAAVARAAENAR